MADPPSRPARRRGYLVPGVIALTVLGLAALILNLTILAPGPAPHTLSGDDIATLIAAQLQSADQSSSPPQVSCPTEPERKGLVFYCTQRRASGTSEVRVTETSSNGALRIQPVTSGG